MTSGQKQIQSDQERDDARPVYFWQLQEKARQSRYLKFLI
jgi:hypothetical protein